MVARIAAIVYSKGEKRVGRGFSREELKAIKLTVRKALKLKIPVDVKRKTRYEENIETLKNYLTQIGEKTLEL
ncbi:MAG: ribosomal protein L13e [Candidatus Bathyarchaeia archaeon]